MKRINPLRYYFNNKKRMILLLTIISIAVFCISSIMTLVSSVYDSCKKANVDVFNYFSIVQESREQAGKWVSENEETIVCFDSSITTTSITTVLGTTSSYIIAVSDMDGLMNELDINVIEGERPSEGSCEILVNNGVASNKKLKIGDQIGSFTVSGIFDGDMQVSFCCLSDFSSLYGSYSLSMLVVPVEKSNMDRVNELCDELDEDAELITRETQLKNLNAEFETMNLIMDIIVIMVSICLAIAVSAFVYTSYANRSEEFAIYYALGYGIRNIIQLILEETVYISVFAYVVGNGISILIMEIVESQIYKPIGQTMNIISAQNMCFTLIIPLLVILFSGVPVIHKLKKTDLLMLIERR